LIARIGAPALVALGQESEVAALSACERSFVPAYLFETFVFKFDLEYFGIEGKVIYPDG
jgi:hypothetical protein